MNIGKLLTTKIVRFFAVISTAGAISGCGTFLPSFDDMGVNAWTHDVPVNNVVNQAQCELKEFIKQYPGVFDPEQSASLSLSLQVDQTGSVTYLGVDLNKLGLTSLASFISVQNKTPSLQAKAQLKTTVSSQVDLSVPQTYLDQPVKAKYVVDPDTGKLKFVPASLIKGLQTVDCSDSQKKMLADLSLKQWFEKFFRNVYDRDARNPTTQACMSKITLKTQFVIVLDVSAGVNPIGGTAYILPINGLSLDYNPQFTHSLTLALSLKNTPVMNYAPKSRASSQTEPSDVLRC